MGSNRLPATAFFLFLSLSQYPIERAFGGDTQTPKLRIQAEEMTSEESEAFTLQLTIHKNPEFLTERKMALKYLDENYREELRRDTVFLGPIESALDSTTPKNGIDTQSACTKSAYDKLKASANLPVLLILKPSFFSIFVDEKVEKAKILKNFERLALEGKVNQFPLLKAYYESLKKFNIEKKLKGEFNLSDQHDRIKKNRQDELMRLAPKLAKFGFNLNKNDPYREIIKIYSVSPSCFTFSGIQKFENFLDEDRMRAEGQLILDSASQYFEKEKKIVKGIKQLDLDRENPVVM